MVDSSDRERIQESHDELHKMVWRNKLEAIIVSPMYYIEYSAYLDILFPITTE